MKVVVGGGMGVHLRDLAAELDGAGDRVFEAGVAREADLVDGGHEQLHETPTLLVGDLPASVDGDDGREAAELVAVAGRPAELLGEERRQVINVGSDGMPEDGSEDQVSKMEE